MNVCFDRYPDKVKEVYKDILWHEVADGNNGQMFVSEEMCFKVLDDSTLFSKWQRTCKRSMIETDGM